MKPENAPGTMPLSGNSRGGKFSATGLGVPFTGLDKVGVQVCSRRLGENVKMQPEALPENAATGNQTNRLNF
jgi:hypothetical protein